MAIFEALRWILPLIIIGGILVLLRFAHRSVRNESSEPTMRWYAGLVLIVIILAVVSWIIVMVPSTAILD